MKSVCFYDLRALLRKICLNTCKLFPTDMFIMFIPTISFNDLSSKQQNVYMFQFEYAGICLKTPKTPRLKIIICKNSCHISIVFWVIQNLTYRLQGVVEHTTTKMFFLREPQL